MYKNEWITSCHLIHSLLQTMQWWTTEWITEAVRGPTSSRNVQGPRLPLIDAGLLRRFLRPPLPCWTEAVVRGDPPRGESAGLPKPARR
jgi:hypothetical protein